MIDGTTPASVDDAELRVPRTTRHILIAVLLAVLAGVTLLNSLGRAPVDIKPEVYLAPWRTAWVYLSAWQPDPQLGFPSFNVGVAPVAAVVGVMQLFGISAGVSAHLLRGLLAAITGWGTARLYRTLVDERDDVGALTAAAVAVANPYTLVAGSTLAIALPLALLPWQLVAVADAVRRGGWRGPAFVALTFFAMSGANAGVIPLLQGIAVPIVAFVVGRADGIRAIHVVGALARSALLSLLVSLYWIVPAISATAAGTTVLSNSESLSGIAGVSSFAEVLRGLGLWPMYGADQDGPWQPQFVAYLDEPVVVVASFALPLLLAIAVAVTAGVRRRIALWLVVPAVVIMVGINPVAAPSPFGRLMRYVFEHVPATGAFRTTNKVGAVFVMGLALLVASGFAAIARAAPRAARPRLGICLAAVLVAGTTPAWAGNLYTSFVDVPGYWHQAAAALNTGSSERVWFVPGEVQSQYRWSDRRPDDISMSLLKRPSLVRTVIPVTGVAAANLLAAVDTGLQEGWLAPGALSTSARYLGVDTLLLRNDQVWENDGGARPQVLQDVINGDPGLVPVRNYGRPGQNIAGRSTILTPTEAILPPLQQWSVFGAQPVVRAQPASSAILVAGDGYALDQLVSAGLVNGTQAFRYLGDVAASRDGSRQFEQAVRDGDRIVLTDTNRRRTTVARTLTDGQGPLLPAGADPGDTRSLWGAADQTVLEDEGADVSASQTGSVFGALPYASAENAFDGNPGTSWQFGDFRTGVGATLTASFAEQAVPSVIVHTATGNTHITSLRLTLGAGKQVVRATVPVDGAGVARWTPPAGTRADRFTLRVAAIAGTNFNRLAVSEVDIPGLHVRRVARLPTTLDRLVARSGAGTAVLDHTPIDVEFARVTGTTDTTADDEENELDRNFSLPVERRYRVSGSVFVRTTVPDSELDSLAGADRAVTADSTSRYFDGIALRASSAVDGNPATAWVPGTPSAGQSLTITDRPQKIARITLTQTTAPGSTPNVATRIRVSLDGHVVTEAAAHLGTTVIRFPARRARTLTIEILKTRSTRSDAVVRFSEIGFGNARMHFDASRARSACVGVGTLDGRALRVHPAAPLTTGATVAVTPCATLSLASGSHRLRSDSADPLVLDRLSLADTLRGQSESGAAPLVSVVHHDQTSYTIRTTGGSGAYWLGLGQSLDPRWRATLDGRDLGAPQLLDGWQTAWRVEAAGGTHTITVTYAPQRTADIALAVSAVALVGCVVLASGLARRRSRRRRLRTSERRRIVTGDPAARRAWLWPAFVIGAYLFGGWLAGVVALVTALVCAFLQVSGRQVAFASALVFATVPVLWLALRPNGVQISPMLVTANPWPGRAALVGLVLLVAAGLLPAKAPAPTRGLTGWKRTKGARG